MWANVPKLFHLHDSHSDWKLIRYVWENDGNDSLHSKSNQIYWKRYKRIMGPWGPMVSAWWYCTASLTPSRTSNTYADIRTNSTAQTSHFLNFASMSVQIHCAGTTYANFRFKLHCTGIAYADFHFHVQASPPHRHLIDIYSLLLHVSIRVALYLRSQWYGRSPTG